MPKFSAITYIKCTLGNFEIRAIDKYLLLHIEEQRLPFLQIFSSTIYLLTCSIKATI
jgi:hypothetical protein